MIQYLIYSSFCAGLLLMVYKLFLEKENMHRFKRFYLLSAILFSYSVPFIVVRKTVEIVSQQFTQTGDSVTDPVAIADTINWESFALAIFALVSVLLFARLIYNLYKVISKVNTHKRRKYQNATLILNTEDQIPHSFLNYIFISEHIFENTESEKEILHHELAHVNQKHSYDILFIELIRCLFWINPFLYFYKRAIQLNHEFLADEAVNNSFKNVYSYQILLLEKVGMYKAINIASQFNYQVTKKRLMMMTKTTPAKIKACKQFAILPILLVSMYVFGRNVVVQQKIVDQPNNIAVQDSVIKPQITNVKRNAKPVAVANTDKKRLKKLSPIKIKLGRLDGNLGQLAPLNGSLGSLK
jgi:bla regulator protein BlaR1